VFPGLLGALSGPRGCSLPTLQGIASGAGFSSVMLFGVGWVVAFSLRGGVWAGFFGFEPDIVRRVETSRSGLYEGLGCFKRMVYV
jgi:hypothetical protein